MGKNSSKTKLIILACCMAAVVVVLVIVLVSLNKDDKTGDNETNIKSNEVTEALAQDKDANTSEVDKVVVTDTPTITDTEKTDPTPTEVISESVTVKLGDYKGIKTTYSPVIITDKDVDKTLNKIKSELTIAVYMPDRPFENGDMAIVTYKGKLDGKVIEDLYAVCMQVVLGRGTLPKVFEDEIIGRKKGDTFTISMDYPEDFEEVPEVAGRTVTFEVELVDGFVFEIPEIDDELIRQISDYSTLEEYRTTKMAELQKEQDDIAYEAAIKDIKSKVIENASFSGPLDNEIKKNYVLRINELNTQYQDEYMMDAASYYNLMYGTTPEDFTKTIMEEAAFTTKYNLILSEIAKTENISLEEADKLVIDSAVIDGLER